MNTQPQPKTEKVQLKPGIRHYHKGKPCDDEAIIEVTPGQAKRLISKDRAVRPSKAAVDKDTQQ